MERVPRAVLLEDKSNNYRTLNVHDFCELIFKFHKSQPCDISFHYFMDTVTLLLSQREFNDLHELMMRGGMSITLPINKSVLASCAQLTNERMHNLFRMLDINHNSSRCARELAWFLGLHDQETLGKRFQSTMMRNGDGQLDVDEFSNMVIKFAGS